jgi:hypothetical protein
MSTRYIPKSKRHPVEKNILAIALLIIVVVGINKKSTTVKYEKGIDSGDPALEEGYLLKEHSSYHQSFTAEKSKLKQINVHLQNYLVNNALFVVSVQQGTENVISTIQSDDMLVTGQYISAYYIMDLSDVELNAGDSYDLYIYTGFIEENQQEPTITKVEYVYE